MDSTWPEVKELFSAALATQPEERDSILSEAGEGLRAEVLALLSAHEAAGDFIQQPALVDVGLMADDKAKDDAAVTGQQIGSYKIVRELGRGGMGAVYLAARADQSFDKQVALKLIKRGMDSEAIIKRFMMERQILANLDHPNIARMIDGGTTEDGLPYFVLDYIEGTTITRYCDEHKLNTTERLKLFRQVCAAVQFAHQNLIVHRDLKPSNILVTKEGAPKLLDFGIAKLLSADWASPTDATETTARLLTPEYASPEQLRALPMTTTSDVYSLGVVLYELLSGHRPFRFESRSPEEIARLITTSEPVKPSAVFARTAANPVDDEEHARTPEEIGRRRDGTIEKLRRRLAGDLDNILLKALRKQPERRYASVQEFSEDLRRHLEGLPVHARPDTLAYRTSKFVTRHKAAVTAALVVLLTLTSATVITAWEARVARRERNKSEQRFNQVRKLATTVLFEYHDGIEKLPGSTPLREKMVKDALAYLDQLDQEGDNDAGLRREIASAYQKVGDVQGNPTSGNLGDLAGALRSYQKALTLREGLVATDGNAGERRDLAVTYAAIADVFTNMVQFDKAIDNYRKAIAVDEGILSVSQNDQEARGHLSLCYRKLGFTTAQAGDLKSASDIIRKARDLSELVFSADPTSSHTRRDLALTYTSMGEITAEGGNMAGALESFRKALAIDQELLSNDSANSDNQQAVASDYLDIGQATFYSNDPKGALENYRKAFQIFKSVELADPRNARAKFNVARGYRSVADMLAQTGNEAEAVETYRKAAQALDDLVQMDSANSKSKANLALILKDLAILLAKRGDSMGALDAGQKSLTIAEQISAANPSNTELKVIVATVLSALGSVHAALASDTKHGEAMRLVEWREARGWFQKSMDIWTILKAGGKFTSVEYDGPEKVQQEIARCDAALAKSNTTETRVH